VACIEFTVFVKGVGLAFMALLKSSFVGTALAKSRLDVSVPPTALVPVLASVAIKKYFVPLVTLNPSSDAGVVPGTFPVAQAPATATRLPGVPVHAEAIVV
jgi:hypothetical protein